MKNEQTKLDDLDLKILNELQNDGKISNVDLASIVNISPPSCLRRVKSLEEKGFIRGYNAILNPELLGFKSSSFSPNIFVRPKLIKICVSGSIIFFC